MAHVRCGSAAQCFSHNCSIYESKYLVSLKGITNVWCLGQFNGQHRVGTLRLANGFEHAVWRQAGGQAGRQQRFAVMDVGIGHLEFPVPRLESVLQFDDQGSLRSSVDVQRKGRSRALENALSSVVMMRLNAVTFFSCDAGDAARIK